MTHGVRPLGSDPDSKKLNSYHRHQTVKGYLTGRAWAAPRKIAFMKMTFRPSR